MTTPDEPTQHLEATDFGPMEKWIVAANSMAGAWPTGPERHRLWGNDASQLLRMGIELFNAYRAAHTVLYELAQTMQERAQEPCAEGTAWLRAAVAWEVCASIHSRFASKTDAVYSTRQADFLRNADNCRAKAEGAGVDLTAEAPFYTSGCYVRGPARPSGSGYKETVFCLPSEKAARMTAETLNEMWRART